MHTKFLLPAGLAAGLAFQLGSPAMANPVTVTASASPGLVIPDNDLNGLASTITLNAPFDDITGVELTLDIGSGFNGDYYAYLQYSSGFVLLLNNLGGSVNNPYGSPGSGFNIIFSDAAASISSAPMTGGSPLMGTWAPQAGSLSTFNGMGPSGDWTFFIADKSPGGVGKLENWILSVTGDEVTSIPDNGSTLVLLAFGAGPLVLFYACIRPPRPFLSAKTSAVGKPPSWR